MKIEIRNKIDDYVLSILKKDEIDKDEFAVLMAYNSMIDAEEQRAEIKKRQEEDNERLKSSMATMMEAWR